MENQTKTLIIIGVSVIAIFGIGLYVYSHKEEFLLKALIK